MKITVIKKAAPKNSKPQGWCPWVVDDFPVQK
jgi:hypothetical protein